MFPKIDSRLQLHQELIIIYVVDGYLATLRNEDGYGNDVIIAEGKGDNIKDALINLENIL